MNAAKSHSPEAGPIQFGVAILGAGFSRRMGTSKLLLPWRETTVIGHSLHVWHASGASEFAVVMRPDDSALAAELDKQTAFRVHRIFNPAAERGMFSSVQAAARWNGWTNAVAHVVLSLGDQPHVPQATLKLLLQFAARNPNRICQPSWQQRAKHPVILPRALLSALANHPGPTLRDFLQEHRSEVAVCEIDDSSLADDLDTPEDYAKLRAAHP